MSDESPAGNASVRQKEALTRLTRLTNRRPKASVHLDRALDQGRLEELIALITEVAAESGEAAGQVLLERIEGISSVPLLEKVMEYCDQTMGRGTPNALRDVALVTNQHLLNLLPAKDDEIESLETLAAVARLSTNLATRLDDLGRWEEALAMHEKSLWSHRRLAEHSKNPEHSRLFGVCLSNTVIRYLRLNRWLESHERSVEAVAYGRLRVSEDPSVENLHLLASCLDNHSIALCEVGEPEAGLVASKEAVEIRRALLGQRKGSWTDLAGSLSSCSGRLFDLGRAEEARSLLEESVDIRRELGHRESHAANQSPDLARSLHNLGIVHEAIGDVEEAIRVTEEAVELRRKLNAGRPDTFGFDLARSLHSLGLYRQGIGESELAYGHFSEAIALRRQWAEGQPETLGSLLADSLSGRSSVRELLEDPEGSIRDGIEAITLRAPFVAPRLEVELGDFETDIRRILRLLMRAERWSEMIEIIDLALRSLDGIPEGPETSATDLVQWLAKSREIAGRQSAG